MSEEATNHIIKMPELDYNPDPRGLGYLYYETMLKNKDKVAQIEGRTGKEDTFGQLLMRSIRVALSLNAKGIQHGDVISVCTNHHLNSCVPAISSMFLGAIFSSLEPSFTVTETAFLLKQVTPKIIFVESTLVELIQKSLADIKSNVKIIVFGHSSDYTTFDELVEERPDEEDFKPFVVNDIRETTAIFFSSGTTGYPKCICINHYSLMCQAVNKTKGLEVSSALMVSYSTTYWLVFLGILTLSITKGIPRVVYPTYDPKRAWEMFDYKVTYALISAAQMVIMCKQGKPDHVKADRLQDIQISADIAKKEYLLQMRKIFPTARVHSIYGQTEIPMAATLFDVCNPRDLKCLDEKPTSVGTGMYGMSYKIVDIDTEEILGPNKRGELCIKTEFQTNGYHNLDSSIIWDSEGFLKTGDIGYYDEDHCFYVVGRIKEMFKFQLFHVLPNVIEDILVKHPAIEKAVVTGIPHESDGEWPMALVVLKSSFENTTPEEIVAFSDARVPNRQRLRGGVKIVSSIPLTTTGKMNRRKVKEMVLKDLDGPLRS